MPNILIKLPKDRTQEGTITLTADGGATFTWDCKGKADNLAAIDHGNPTRDPTKSWGDTPLGVYDTVMAITRIPIPDDDMGATIIPLRPLLGDALLAKENGRTGLYIHGGRGNDYLFPTHGCVRMYDKDIDALLAIATVFNSITIAAL